MRNKLIVALVLVLQVVFFSKLFSQYLPTYNLDGELNADGQKLTLMFRISEVDGKLNTLLFVPEQLLYKYATTKTELIGDSIIIEIKSLDAVYRGIIDYQENMARGYFMQQGLSFTLDLNFVDSHEAVLFERYQEPEPPFTYHSEEHIIRDNKVNIGISGTLSLPNKIDKFPLVILITGSGPQDRNQTIAGHKPFLVIADYLTKNGIAVFRYDERGVGKSNGNFAAATSADFTYDVLNIVKYFKIHPNVDSKRIGLIGHSEGGLVAMKAAARNKRDIAYIISLAGPKVSGIDLLQKQMKDILTAQGMDSALVCTALKFQKEAFEISLKTKEMVELRKALVDLQNRYTENYTDEEIALLGLNQRNINSQVMSLSSAWMKYFLKTNPQVYLKKLKCPVLAVFGSNDIQVNANINAEAFEEVMSSKKNQIYQTKILKDLNHLFQSSNTGEIKEYLLIDQTISPDVLKIMEEFIKTH